VSVRRLLCVIDCCRADEVSLIPDKMKACTRVVLRSSEGKALANPMAGSRFTRYFLAGLRSARKCPCDGGIDCRLLKEFREKSLRSGFVTLANLFSYTAQHMEGQKPRQDVYSYDDSDIELAFFNEEPLVYSLQLVHGNTRLPDVEVEEQKIDFSASFDDIVEQLRQEIPCRGVYMCIILFINAGILGLLYTFGKFVYCRSLICFC